MTGDEQKMEKYRQIFEEVQCDTNNDNFICIKELKAFLRSKHHSKDLPAHKIKYVFKLADKDGDKTVNFDEFVDLLEHPDFQHLFGHYMNSYIKFLIPQHKQPDADAKRKIVPKGRSIRVRTDRKVEELSMTNFGTQRRVSVDSSEIQLFVQDEDEISYIDELTCCPPPFAMVLITLLELAFFLTDEINEPNSTLTGTGVTANIFIYDPSKRKEVWRFLTYMFVHIGYFHLIVNLAVQLVLGLPLEMVHKWWRVSLLYFAGVIAGSLATSITDPQVRLAGASGGAYALITAHIATIIMNWSEMTLPIVQVAIFVLVAGADLGKAVYDRFFLNINSQVGCSAHLGGAVAGLLVGIYLLKNLNVKKCEKYLWWAALVTYVILMLTAILMNIFLPNRYAK